MAIIDEYIKNFIELRKVQEYSLESIRIEKPGLKLKENQVLFIQSYWTNLPFAYASADVYFDSSRFPGDQMALTQNLGYIQILKANPTLYGTLLTITKYASA